MSAQATLSVIASEYTALGLLVVVEAEPQVLTPKAEDLVRRALSAALAAGVADVTVSVSESEDPGTRLDLRVRAIDRSVAIDYARRLDLAGLRVELERQGGKLIQASARFAIFHIQILL